MRPSEGGAFLLPSVGRVPLHPLSDTQTHAKARQTAMKPDLAHGRGFRPDVLTNRPSDCGASAVQSSAVPPIDDCPDCGADDGWGRAGLFCRTRREQGRLRPGARHNGDNHRIIDRAAADQRGENGDVGARLGGQRSACRQMIFIACRAGVVGGKKTGRAVAIMQFPQIRRAGDDVVVRIVWVSAEAIAKTQTCPCRRHDLHQAHGAFGRQRPHVAEAFGSHHRAYPGRRNAEALRGFRHEAGNLIGRRGDARRLRGDRFGVGDATAGQQRDSDPAAKELPPTTRAPGHRAALDDGRYGREGGRDRAGWLALKGCARAGLRHGHCLLVGPEGRRFADDGCRRQRPEIPAVEGVLGLPVHEEDLALGDDAAALPDGKRATAAIVFERLAHGGGVDGDGAPRAADRLSGERQDVLQEGHALGQIAALGEEVRQRRRRAHHDQLGDVQVAGRSHAIQPDRHAGAGVPDQLRRGMNEGGNADRHRREIRHHHCSETRHDAILRRLSHAEC